MIDEDELFRIAEPVILVDVPSLISLARQHA
jgi:hypothetical protein